MGMGGSDGHGNDNGPTEKKNFFQVVVEAGLDVIVAPVVWFRENIVTPNQQYYPWYHQQFRRVPTIDNCYTDDVTCIYEANMQFKRDRYVECEIMNILRTRLDDCVREEHPDGREKCMKYKEEYLLSTENWFMKYGDIGAAHDVRTAFMKQKHRLLWERRHGPVGTGMRKETIGSETPFVE